MRTRLLVSPLLVLLLAGCTHQQAVTPGLGASFAALNEQAARRQATVTLAGGDVHTARALQMTADSTSWLDPETEAVIQVATGEVLEVRFVNRDQGAIEGFGLGILAGAALGAMLGFAEGDDPPCEGLCLFQMTAAEKAALGAAGLGLLGGAVGLVTGAFAGSHGVYRIERAAPAGDGENAAPVSSAAYRREGHEPRRPLP